MVWGRKWLTRYLREEDSRDDGKVVEGEYDIQRSKRELYERLVIPTVVYGSETCSLSAQESTNIEVFEMMYLRNICGIRIVDRVRNAIKRERWRCELSVLEIIERNVLKWLGHAERMGEETLVKRVYQANVEGNRGR